MVDYRKQVARIRALTGITLDQVSDEDLEELLDVHDGAVYCAAADAADLMGTYLIGGAGVTSVEDISVDARRPIGQWQVLADRLRSRCEREQAEAWDDGPSVVEFHPWGHRGPEVVEHGHS